MDRRLTGRRAAIAQWATEALYRCAACGATIRESRLLCDEEGDPVACPHCMSGWVDEIEGEDYGQGEDDEPECGEG